MKRQRTRSKSTKNPADLFDALDLSISSSTNVDELKHAYQSFTNLGNQAQCDLLVYAGPARTIALALRGYEMPSLGARVASSGFLTTLVSIIDQRETPVPLREQLWLMLAQQREVLLERIEADLESLEVSSLPVKTQRDWRTTLTESYELIRAKSQRAIRQLFTVPLRQPQLPLEVRHAW